MVDLAFPKTPLCDAVNIIGQQSDISLLCEPEHAFLAEVAANAGRVSLKTALDKLADATGLSWERVGKAVLISTPETIAEARASLEETRQDFADLYLFLPGISERFEKPVTEDMSDVDYFDGLSLLARRTMCSHTLRPGPRTPTGNRPAFRKIPLLEALFWLARFQSCEVTWYEAPIQVGPREEIGGIRAFGFPPSRALVGVWSDLSHLKALCQVRLPKTKGRALGAILGEVSSGVPLQVVLHPETAKLTVDSEHAGMRTGRFLGQLFNGRVVLHGEPSFTEFVGEVEGDRLSIRRR